MIICAGRNESFPFAKSIGVGLIESAINLTKICLENKPDFLVFIGSAGSYGEYKIFDIIESSNAANIELSFFTGDSYTPLDNVIKTNNKSLANDTIVNSSNYISTNENISKRFIEKKIGIENMEFYALCKVAQKFDIDISGIFIVTNYTNKNAHEDFIKNHKLAMTKLVNYLAQNKYIVKKEDK